MDYNLSSVDVRQAYLQAEVTEELYMRPPPGVHAYDAFNLLHAPLYHISIDRLQAVEP